MEQPSRASPRGLSVPQKLATNPNEAKSGDGNEMGTSGGADTSNTSIDSPGIEQRPLEAKERTQYADQTRRSMQNLPTSSTSPPKDLGGPKRTAACTRRPKAQAASINQCAKWTNDLPDDPNGPGN